MLIRNLHGSTILQLTASGHAIGVDTGGTFTDIVLLTPNGESISAKAPTTPHDFSIGVMNAVAELARLTDVDVRTLLGRTAVFKHGTTVATNALITRSGAKVGFITTRGFEDTTLIMRAIGRVDGLPEEEVRRVAYVTKPEPLVPRELIRGVRERIDCYGTVIVPLQMDDVGAAVRDLVDEEGCTAVAVSLLHAWVNPEHEQRIREFIQQRNGRQEVFWSFASDLSKVAGEYARANTAIANSFVGPTVQRYLSDLEAKLRQAGLQETFLVMQGNGGASSRQQATPISNLQSGPAGGMIASAYMAGLLGHDRVLTADMGGTSLDVSMLVEGEWKYAEESVFERFRILQPISQIESIGAGGGTIARVDELTGRLLVGPKSAGASPGPVCYGDGGAEVTVTDADLLLGYIDPELFLAGRKPLDKGLAERAVHERLASKLRLDVIEAAAGVYEIINNKMADLIRTQIVKSGYLPNDFVLYAFGGAGPVHAVGFASELGIRQIYVFPTSPVFSAFGAAAADVMHTRVMTYQAHMPADPAALNALLDGTEQELLQATQAEGFPAGGIAVKRHVTLRYRRQTHGLEIPLEWPRLDAERVEALSEQFNRRYEEVFGVGSGFPEAGIEINSVRIDAVGQAPKPQLSASRKSLSGPESALKGKRQAYFDGAFQTAAIYDHELLTSGSSMTGPAIIEAPFTSVVLPPGWMGSIDAYRNVVLEASA